MKIDTLDRIEGILIGTAVGDALGLPMECMKPSTIRRLGWSNKWKHRFIMNRGMWSDDTEHTIMLAQALLVSEGNVNRFKSKFAWELRWWFLGLPSGVGMATARSIIKLWFGHSPSSSGVFSAGNGPSMRAAVIAAYFPHEKELRCDFCMSQTKISHVDPKAAIAANVVSELTAKLLSSTTVPTLDEVLNTIEQPSKLPNCEEWSSIIKAIHSGAKKNTPLNAFIETIGIDAEKGISGYAYHTVPAVIYSGIINDWDYEPVVTEIIKAGGDTDTTAAIAGALCGAYCGASAIPHQWIASIAEWPTGIADLKVLAKAIQTKTKLRVRAYWSPSLLLRNCVFFIIVLKHGFARLMPDALRTKCS
jgi:ADP-ribosylglycohydrolase